uniref:PX domain-containing protein n=1 Tax=Noctiluca scintillans TaxID=2966 RepID=A0A7S1AY39_NOCSC|mmetsp:Transcript_64830/g.171599  ORF Transcript_64830/g.171599 Transcript_64830/m.171599 type:complete len:193 (+) Transcript_64830:100-678(+)
MQGLLESRVGSSRRPSFSYQSTGSLKGGKQLRVHVVGHANVEQGCRRHVEYDLFVTFGRESWSTRCRFSRFVRAHAQLKRKSVRLRRDNGLRLPPRPSRLDVGILGSIRGKVSERVVEDIERYIAEVLACSTLLGDAIEELYDLLDVSPEIRTQLQNSSHPREGDKVFQWSSHRTQHFRGKFREIVGKCRRV